MMKKFGKRTFKLCVIFISIIFLSYEAQAQPDPDGDPDAPIDGGVSLLVAAGIGYGIKKVNDHRKKKNTHTL
jgi:hypothetical protein